MENQSIANQLLNAPLLMHPREVASVMRISAGLVYKLIKTGQLPAIRIGRTVRISADDLQLFIENSRTHK